MKHAIITLLLILFFVSGFGQKIEFGLNAGTAYNTAPFYHPYMPIENYVIGSYHVQGAFSPDVFITTACNFKHFQAGIQAGATWLKYNISYVETDNQSIATLRKYHSNFGLILPVKAFIDHITQVGKMQLYAGVSIGCDAATFAAESQWIAGVKVGSTWFFTKRFGLNLDVEGNYLHMPLTWEPNSPAFNALQFPVTIGIRYHLLK